MTITLIIFLYLYLALLLVFLFFAFFNIYHVIRFSFWDFSSFFATFIFIAGTVIILSVSFTHIKEVDWQKKLEISPTKGVIIDPFTQDNFSEDDVFAPGPLKNNK